MRFSELIQRLGPLGARAVGQGDPDITGVAIHSKKVHRGDIFITIAGAKTDGCEFIDEALKRGAVAVLSEREFPNLKVPCICVPSTRTAAADAAAAVFREPARSMTVIGVTGTNGKTTTASLLRFMLERDHRGCALLGTIGYSIGGRELPAPNTTPDPVSLHSFFRDMLDAGIRYCSMEVSSIALHQERVRGIRFSAAIFTNLTLDHLDYHKTMDQYRASKKLLFDGLDSNSVAIGNAQDPETARLFMNTRARRVLYGIDGERFPSGPPHVLARIVRADLDGFDFLLRAPNLGGQGAVEVKISSPFLGAYNVQNILAAASAALALGVAPEAIVSGIETIGMVPGRLERVDGGRAYRVFVDYAHTPDGLRRVLQTLRPLTRRKLTVVFGCGGDRDRGKRPIMGAVAAENADKVVITSDNPRSEKPESIVKDIMGGIGKEYSSKITVELDRRRAIGIAVDGARPGDVILLAGKGHETYQIIGDDTFPFDDRIIAREALSVAAN
ncbi:MAG: UDP-N-acetylmuramoyl-L-alanyl-D-glutamate--2,6-diaminopimelate ligase [Planctomycetes bacterium]|nr:UDP-N-acetylmuramoyl-L-alanyl-D-glutamate--2,6-diaminopimelate ligase [Planctomycetota bacterium]